jgi:serine/threonine protein kinase
MPANIDHALQPGTFVDDFRIDSVIGMGGFGITYRAFDQQLERTVALKEYFPNGLATRASGETRVTASTDTEGHNYEYGLDRFLSEARTLAKFQHPSIVRVNRFLETNDTAYLVMDFEEGMTLGETIARTGPMSPDQILILALHMLQGLQVVHEKQYLHRDVKPANILIRFSGPPVLLDFGSARLALEQQSQNITVILSPGYAPIEQFDANQRQGPYTDIYALGATLFHCAFGKPPAPSTRRALAGSTRQPDPLADELSKLANLSPKLLAPLEWMLKFAPDERPQSVHELIDILEAEVGTEEQSLGDILPVPESEQTTRMVPSAQRPTLAIDPEPTSRLVRDDISEELLDAATAALAEFLGPISKVIVNKAHQVARAPSEFVEYLGDSLDDEDERRRFFEALQQYVDN